MSKQKAVTLRLPIQTFSRLESAAERLGVRPGTMARMLIHASLDPRPTTDPKLAIQGLARIRAELPRVDAVKLVRRGRDQLDERTVRD